MREECMFCSAYGQCGLATYNGFDSPNEAVCDLALETEIENGRREFYEVWYEYIREYD